MKDALVSAKYVSGCPPSGDSATSAAAGAPSVTDQCIGVTLKSIHICLSVEFLVALNNFVVVAINNSAKHLDSLKKLQELQAEATQSDATGSGADTRLRRMSRDARASVVRRFSVNPAATDGNLLRASPVPETSSSSSASPSPIAVKKAPEPESAPEVEGKIELLLSMECPEVVLISDAKSENSKAILLHGFLKTHFMQTTDKMMVTIETRDIALRHLRYKDIILGNVDYGRQVFKPCSLYGRSNELQDAFPSFQAFDLC